MNNRKYTHLSRQERYKIKETMYKDMSITEIAKALNRSKGAVSMEIRRNKDGAEYLPCRA